MLQLLCIAFLPFPTAIVGEHVSDPLAQEFYFAAILVTGLATMALWWYSTTGSRLIDPELPSSVIRRFHMTLLVGPVVGSIALTALVGVGIGRLINPLLLQYLFLVGYIMLGVLEGWEPRSEERGVGGTPGDGASPEERREDSARTDARVAYPGTPSHSLANFSELRACEVRRIPLPRTPVNSVGCPQSVPRERTGLQRWR